MTKIKAWGEMSPEMRALPNDKWRNFVIHYLTGPAGHGSRARAAELAGLVRDPKYAARRGYTIYHDPRVIAAIAVESKKYIRSHAPDAAKALMNMIHDPAHKDHARAVSMLLNRVDPEVQLTDMRVTHTIVDPDVEALEELRALRALNTPREKLLELYGHNGLERVERLEAADKVRLADAAKVIETDYKEVPQNG
jgi:hypothetical protein